jgi:magnesium chelatase family protein
MLARGLAGLLPEPAGPVSAPAVTLRPSRVAGAVEAAAGGVLVLDDLPAFRPRVLDALKLAVERRAGLLVVATMRACPCGLGQPWCDPRDCGCTPAQLRRWWARVAPVLDLFDLAAGVPRLTLGELRRTVCEPSGAVAARVATVRRLQTARGALSGSYGPEQRSRFCSLDRQGIELLEAAWERLALTGRAVHAALGVARTLADLAGRESIGAAHLAEAIQYRSILAERKR